MRVVLPRPRSAVEGRRFRSSDLQRAARSAVIYALVAGGSILFLIPLAWMVSTSFKTMQQAFVFPPEWIPNPLVVSAYVKGWTVLPFPLYYRNTLIITLLSVVGATCSSSIVAYGFARLRFRGRDTLFLVLLATMMLPSQVTMIPIYVGFVRLHLVNTFVPLVLPLFFGVPFYIFLLRQFFLTLPQELDDAAKIDGAGYFGLLWRICLPLAKPAIAAVAIFAFVGSWNDFTLPLIYLQSESTWTVPIGLYQFGGPASSWSVHSDLVSLMAMSTLAIVPEIAIFFLAQKYFVQGIVMSGIKG